MNPVISAEEFQAFAQSQSVLLIDARGGPGARESFRDAHLPGAVFVDLETELSRRSDDPRNGGRHPLPSPQDFSELMARIGAEPGKPIVVYDDKRGANAAARFWWMASAIGHPLVAVLDGDLQSVLIATLGFETGETVRHSTPYRYAAERWGRPLVEIGQVEDGLRSGNSLIVDVRESYRYRGESEPIDLVAGHIPGAINLPFIDSLAEDGRLLEPNQLREYFSKWFEGYQSHDVLVHCGSGVTACHTLLALESAGLRGAALYVGSWSEWSRSGRPVARSN